MMRRAVSRYSEMQRMIQDTRVLIGLSMARVKEEQSQEEEEAE